MNIIILGAGQVGGSLADCLTSEEKHDITIVDKNISRLNELNNYLDIRTIEGYASCPDILEQANAADADILIAVTNNDEVNMLACEIAYTLFKTPKKIARIRQTSYLKKPEIFNNAIHVDAFIKPEELITNHLKNLIKFPGVIQLFDFANKKVQLICIYACIDLKIEEQRHQLHTLAPKIKARMIAIFREKQFIAIENNTVIKKGDEVLFIAENNNIKPLIKSFGYKDKPQKNIIIAGGGYIGFQVAQSLQLKYNLKIIEKNNATCNQLSQNLDKVIVLHGDSSDKNLLMAEAADSADIYLALTNDNETNLISSMLAKQLGAKKVIALVNNSAYINLIHKNEIDVVIATRLIITNNLLRYIRKNDSVDVYFTNHTSKMLELVVHPKNSHSLIGLKAADFCLAKGATIVAILREDQFIITNEDLTIKLNDRLFIFIKDKNIASKVEKNFA